MKFYLGVVSYSRVIAICPKFSDFSVLSPYWVVSGCNFMKLVLNIYDHSVVMHVKFHQDVISYGGVLAL